MPVVKTTPPRKGREAIRIVKPFSLFVLIAVQQAYCRSLCFLLLLCDFCMLVVINVIVVHVLCSSSS
jgi:hypothetical protein